MLQDLENIEYHFIINHFDFSSTFLIIPTYEDYLHYINKLKSEKDVASFFVIKGEQIFNSNSD
jgi:vacuolar-type H+-ATPase subunit D/Vma8